MKRIYHHYKYWEDLKSGFYEITSNNKKEFLINKVKELFENPKLTEAYMNKVITLWPYSCEHNLTNLSLNRIAYLGQAACCIYSKIPFQTTMNAWNLIDINHRNRADQIAKIIITKWELNQKLKNTLMIGSIKGMSPEYQTRLQFQ